MAKFQAPKGTRDFYPEDLLRRRYVEKLWRDVSIRHAFEEIDGPTFESTSLYTVKSGEGIVSEMFGVYSGKDEAELADVRAGKPAPFALRPEFTPTLARMFASRAGALPKPTRWCWMQNCFRAERPQRGRLREFLQWNCDILGDESILADAAAISACVDLLDAAGLDSADARVSINHRQSLARVLSMLEVDATHLDAAFVLLDRREKMSDADLEAMTFEFGIPRGPFLDFLLRPRSATSIAAASEFLPQSIADELPQLFAPLRALESELASRGIGPWIDPNLNIARGLAYYTGMVFEVIATGERAIAGGGRYDGLIELFGGPPTPAVGFGMGDVVLSLLLSDKKLLPEGPDLLDALSAPGPSYRPEAFILTPNPDLDLAVRALTATLRRGVSSPAWLAAQNRKPWSPDRYSRALGGIRPLHARHSSKSTRNLGKLLKDASDQRALLAVILESPDAAIIKDLRTNQQDERPTALPDLPAVLLRKLDAPNA